MIENLPVQITKGIEEIEEAQLYREAGLIKKAESLELNVIKKSNIPLLHVWKSRGDTIKQEIVHSKPDFYNSIIYKLSEYTDDVPRLILSKIMKIKNKEKLHILQVVKKPDPLLLWLIPWEFFGDWYIILEKWE